ncbi:MAG: hypothetical protein OXQ31_26475, partial [Spirochaetaceae bacterium]|nr:hypothetical protein [Spirochaetaceae bacterium]
MSSFLISLRTSLSRGVWYEIVPIGPKSRPGILMKLPLNYARVKALAQSGQDDPTLGSVGRGGTLD